MADTGQKEIKRRYRRTHEPLGRWGDGRYRGGWSEVIARRVPDGRGGTRWQSYHGYEVEDLHNPREIGVYWRRYIPESPKRKKASEKKPTTPSPPSLLEKIMDELEEKYGVKL
jgi:hypothetical protein